MLFRRVLPRIEDPRDVNHIFLNPINYFEMPDDYPAVFRIEFIFLVLVCKFYGFNLFDDLIHYFTCRCGRFREVIVEDDFKVRS